MTSIAFHRPSIAFIGVPPPMSSDLPSPSIACYRASFYPPHTPRADGKPASLGLKALGPTSGGHLGVRSADDTKELDGAEPTGDRAMARRAKPAGAHPAVPRTESRS
jgi:hypothetical protein